MLHLFGKKHPSAAFSLYQSLMGQARDPLFYRDWGVPDEFDGRFDLIVLHLFMLFYRLKPEGEAGKALGQGVFDCFTEDMDRVLRETGVGDLSVPKRLKTMVEAFYGRTGAYESALAEQGDEALAAALARNIWPDQATPDGARMLAHYVRATLAHLEAQTLDSLLGGQITLS